MDESAGNDSLISAMKGRLRKVHVDPAQALSQCMRCPAIATGGGGEGLPAVDADTVIAFAGQLQYDLSREGAERLLKQAAEASGCDADNVPASAFLGLFGVQGAPGGGGHLRPPGAQAQGGSKAFFDRGKRPSSAQVRDEHRRELMQQKGPDERLRQLVLKQRVHRLGGKEQQLITQLRETLFERRSTMPKMFKCVDLNEDGICSLEEFMHALEGAGVPVGHEIDRSRVSVTEEEAARMLAFFDLDGQGVLRYNEFMRLLQGTIEAVRPANQGRGPDRHSDSPPPPPESPKAIVNPSVLRAAVGVGNSGRSRGEDLRKVQTAFEHWDANGDGVITENELLRVLQSLDGRFGSVDVHAMFEAVDINGDGAIDYQEFVSWLFR